MSDTNTNTDDAKAAAAAQEAKAKDAKAKAEKAELQGERNKIAQKIADHGRGSASDLQKMLEETHGLKITAQKDSSKVVATMAGLKGKSRTNAADAVQNWANKVRRAALKAA